MEGTGKFLVFGRIEFTEIITENELWENVLPYDDEKEEGQWKQDSSYRNPCYTKAYEEIYELEERKHRDKSVWYRLHK